MALVGENKELDTPFTAVLVLDHGSSFVSE